MEATEIRIHGLKNCDTTRAAMKALKDRGAVLVDVRETPVDRMTLGKWLKELGPGLVNRASATWRGLGEAERAGDPLDLLEAHPALIKRPVIEGDGRLTMGWTTDARLAWMGGSD